MKASLGIFLFIAIGSAAPTTGPFPRDVISQCKAAENCETYESDIGTLIRFKSGMEPGSDDYNRRFGNGTDHSRVLVKRNTQTYATFGDKPSTTALPTHVTHCIIASTTTVMRALVIPQPVT